MTIEVDLTREQVEVLQALLNDLAAYPERIQNLSLPIRLALLSAFVYIDQRKKALDRLAQLGMEMGGYDG